jgi:hypothetical protein
LFLQPFGELSDGWKPFWDARLEAKINVTVAEGLIDYVTLHVP